MTPVEFKAAIAQFDMTQEDAAEFLHVGVRTLKGWVGGRSAIPYSAATLLRLMIVLNITPEKLAGMLEAGD